MEHVRPRFGLLGTHDDQALGFRSPLAAAAASSSPVDPDLLFLSVYLTEIQMKGSLQSNRHGPPGRVARPRADRTPIQQRENAMTLSQCAGVLVQQPKQLVATRL
jgi:hypothetical protein